MNRIFFESQTVIETVSLINSKYQVNYYMPYNYYLQIVRNIDSKFLSNEDRSSFFYPPFCYDLYMNTDELDLSAYALSHLDEEIYEFSYYIDLEEYYRKMKDYKRKMRLYEMGNRQVFSDKEEIIPSDKTDISPAALSYLDDDMYDFDYYIDLHNYYRQMEEYREKLQLFQAGQKDVFNHVTPVEKEKLDMSAEALAELDGYKWDSEYYIELRDYNLEMEEYNRKMDLFNSGDRDAFKNSSAPSFRETFNLSSEALSILDDYRYDNLYYKDLSDYYQRAQEYEYKLELFNRGDKNIFKRHDISFEREYYELSSEALSYLDEDRYDLDYYRELSNYNKEMQIYERKLELFNSGMKDIFKEEELLLPVIREHTDLSADGMAFLDDYKYDFEYYIEMHNYYKELEEYNEKLELFHRGNKEIFKEESEHIKGLIDIVELKQENDKVWTPPLEDLIAFSRGRCEPYFLNNLFSMLKNVDTDFNEKVDSKNIKLRMNFNTSVINQEEFDRLKKDIKHRLIEIKE